MKKKKAKRITLGFCLVVLSFILAYFMDSYGGDGPHVMDSLEVFFSDYGFEVVLMQIIGTGLFLIFWDFKI